MIYIILIFIILLIVVLARIISGSGTAKKYVICPYCSKKNAEDTLFCIYCGKRISDTIATKPPKETSTEERSSSVKKESEIKSGIKVTKTSSARTPIRKKVKYPVVEIYNSNDLLLGINRCMWQCQRCGTENLKSNEKCIICQNKNTGDEK